MLDRESKNKCIRFYEVENYEMAKADKSKIWILHNKDEEFFSEEEIERNIDNYKNKPEKWVWVTRKGSSNRTEHKWWPHKVSDSRKWFTDGKINILSKINPNPNEFHLGMTKTPSSEETKEMARKARSAKMSQKKWICNGKKLRRIDATEPVPKNWKLGKKVVRGE